MGSAPASSFDVDVLVIGAGFGGCYLLNLMRKAGFSTKVLEAGTTLGGVWCWSRYPGARVDCEEPWYGFSDPAVWQDWVWHVRYPDGSELRRYFEHVDKVWDLSKDVSLNTRVVEARWEDGRWKVKTADGTEHSCHWLLSAAGTSFKQYEPKWEGRDKFQGQIHHSSLWPQSGVDLKGKRVAVIGAGSTGVQVVQESAKVASQVTQFIRTPNLAVPMRQREVTEDEIYAHKAQFPHVFRACRNTFTGLPIENTGRKIMEETPEQRQALWEEQWKRGGFNWTQGCFADHLINEEANKLQYEFWLSKIRPRIKDPKKRELLAPLELPYFMSTKRPSLEQDYYEMCDLPHVDITNSPITGFTETGITTEEKHREFDIVAVCTGYDAVTGGLRTMGIIGKNGVALDDKWQDGVSTHLGMMVNGFPNFYFVYGPQAPTSLTNGPPFIELQCEWIRDVICKQRDEKLPIVEAKQEAEDAWKAKVAEMANKTLAVKTNSWYMGANVPGKKREFLLWMGGIPSWHEECVKALDGWTGFDTHA